MPRSQQARLLGAAAALVLVATACGDDAGPSEDAAETSGTPATESPSDPTMTSTSIPERTLVYDAVQEPPVIGAQVCIADGVCVAPFSILGSSTGEVQGSAVQAGGGALLADGSIFATSVVVFTGSIGGCSGSVAMTSTGFNRAGETSGSVDIIPDTGTDVLAGITGLGTVLTGAADPGGGDQATSRIELRVGSSCAGDAADPGTRTAPEPAGARPVTFDVAFPAATTLAAVCDGLACVLPVSRTGSAISGALEGVTATVGSGAPRPGGGYVGVGYTASPARSRGAAKARWCGARRSSASTAPPSRARGAWWRAAAPAPSPGWQAAARSRERSLRTALAP
jgi:hypothetical protein